ncbi:MAG: CYTH and CHAD domain-containing protein [Acidimicrobiia bacterium]
MLERELKLNAPAEFRLPDLSVSGLGVVAGSRRYLDAVYYDTEDLRLTRWGCSLRHRTNEAWTVKLPPVGDGDLQERLEVRFEGRWDQIPSGAQALVRVYTRRAPLREIARLRTIRKPLYLIDGLGRSVAEIVDDDVSTYRGRGPAGRFREIEIELADGADEEILEEIVLGLRAAGAGSITRMSKLARALGPAGLQNADVVVVEPGDDPSVAAVVEAALARSVHRFMAHMPGVQIGEDPEALHHARVATRRLRSDLRTFGLLLDEQWVASFREELRWMGGALGTVRDVDVLAMRLEATSKRLPAGDLYPLGVMRTMLHAERRKRRAILLEAMAQDRYLELLDRMVDAANHPRLLPSAQQASRDDLLDLVRAPFEWLKQTTLELPAEPPDPDLHRIRIRAKRVRYAAEAVAPAVGKKAIRFAAAAAALQDTLGELQDSTVAYAWLSQAAQLHPAVSFTAGQLAGLEVVRAESARVGWRAAWQELDRSKLRSWM